MGHTLLSQNLTIYVLTPRLTGDDGSVMSKLQIAAAKNRSSGLIM